MTWLSRGWLSYSGAIFAWGIRHGFCQRNTAILGAMTCQVHRGQGNSIGAYASCEAVWLQAHVSSKRGIDIGIQGCCMAV